MIKRHSFRLAALVSLVLSAPVASAMTQEPWAVLPPMPALPPAFAAGPVHVNDIDMWRAEFGPRDGRPVMLVHGGLANSNYFAKGPSGIIRIG